MDDDGSGERHVYWHLNVVLTSALLGAFLAKSFDDFLGPQFLELRGQSPLFLLLGYLLILYSQTQYLHSARDIEYTGPLRLFMDLIILALYFLLISQIESYKITAWSLGLILLSYTIWDWIRLGELRRAGERVPASLAKRSAIAPTCTLLAFCSILALVFFPQSMIPTQMLGTVPWEAATSMGYGWHLLFWLAKSNSVSERLGWPRSAPAGQNDGANAE